MKSLKRATLTGILVSTLVSCTKNKESETKVAPYNGEKVTVQLAVFAPLDKTAKRIIPAFKEKFPNIDIKLKSQGFDEHHTQLQASLAAGEGIPDLAFVEIDYVGALGGGGGFVNLLEEPYNAGPFKENMSLAAWKRGMTSEDSLVAIPIDVAPGTAYYNINLLKQANMKPEDIKSMDDLFELGKRVSKDLDGDGVNDQFLLANVNDIFRMIVGSDDYYYFDKDGNARLDRERIKVALKWVKKFYDAGMTANIRLWSQEWFATFQHGTCAFQFSGAWLAGYLKDWIAPKQFGKFRVAPLPSLEKGGKPMRAVRGGSFAAIPSKAKNKAAAWEFIKFYTQDYKVQIDNYRQIDAFPALTTTWSDPMFEEADSYLGGQKARKLWLELIKQAPDQYVNPNDRLATSLIENVISEITLDKQPVDKAIANAQVELKKRLRL